MNAHNASSYRNFIIFNLFNSDVLECKRYIYMLWFICNLTILQLMNISVQCLINNAPCKPPLLKTSGGKIWGGKVQGDKSLMTRCPYPLRKERLTGTIMRNWIAKSYSPIQTTLDALKSYFCWWQWCFSQLILMFRVINTNSGTVSLGAGAFQSISLESGEVLWHLWVLCKSRENKQRPNCSGHYLDCQVWVPSLQTFLPGVKQGM